MTNRRRMTPEQAKPHALDLLTRLHPAIGDKAAIQDAILATINKHPHDSALIITAALGWMFAEHVRPDPEATTREGAA